MTICDLSFHIRRFIRRDLPEILAIEEDSFEHPWSEGQLTGVLSATCAVGDVAVSDDRIVGYVMYQRTRDWITLLNLAVLPEVRRRGFGSAMIEHLKAQDRDDREKFWRSFDRLGRKRQRKRLRRLSAVLGDRNEAGHVFLRANGFKALGVLREWSEDGQDGYDMVLDPNDES